MISNREKVIKNYINGYNNFDIDKMFADFDESIIFENIQNGEVNMALSGILALKEQAEQAKNYFSSRQQTIKKFVHNDDETEIEIDYSAILAMDFPNGLKKGEKLNLKGKSIFKFYANKVVKLTDVS